MKKILFTTAVLAFMAMPAMADMITVQGTSSIYLIDQGFSVAPTGDAQLDIDLGLAYTRPDVLNITGFGPTIDISATGLWSHQLNGAGATGPAGYGSTDPPGTRASYSAFGISSVNGGPLNALIGVFVGDTVSGSAPAKLIYGTDIMTTPNLQQSFIIGASLQNIMIPVGATRLVLGLNNGYEWSNNWGSVDVTVVPVPGALLLGSLGLGFAAWRLKRRKMA